MYSISPNDYIKGWSDLDTLALKDEVLQDEKKVINLRKFLRFFKYSKNSESTSYSPFNWIFNKKI